MKLARLLLVLVMVLSPALAGAQGEPTNVDPYEPFNRTMFTVNNNLDKYLIRPIAVGYDWIMPGFAKRGVGNMFANFYDFNSSINGVLQWRLAGAGQAGGRFLINSTIGILGLVDVATPMGVRPYRTDFGHTLAIWGFESGPYLMVPFFGPRTVRSGTGFLFDTVASVQWNIESFPVRAGLFALEIVDNRAALSEAEELITTTCRTLA